MMTTPDQKLLEWIRTKRTDLTPDGSIVRLELIHAVDGDIPERLMTIEMADRDEDEDPDDLAQEIWNFAEEDSATRPQGSFQRYVVQAYRGDTREPDEQKAFILYGKSISSLTGSGTEPPTERGERAADMRRTNELHGLLVRVAEHTAVSAAAALERERQENQRLRELGFQAEKMRQELLDRQNERTMELETSRAHNQQMQMLTATILQFAPIILQRLLAPPAPPSAALPLAPPAPAPATAAAAPSTPSSPVVVRDSMVGGLLESMTAEQAGVLMGTFTEEQRQKFLAIYTSFREHPPASPPSGKPPPAN